jgi:hypothetical protein
VVGVQAAFVRVGVCRAIAAGTQPRWGWEFVGEGPRVGLRAAVQPWAWGRNPFGIGVRAEVKWAVWGTQSGALI